MRALLMTLLLGSLSAATLIMPETFTAISDDISIFSDITVETMSLWIRKKSRGHLYFGFGRNATVADVVLLHEENSTISAKSCRFNGTFAGYCNATDDTWSLLGKTYHEDGSWDVYLARDIRINRGVRINSEINWVIAAKGIDENPTAYVMANDLVLVKPFNILTSKIVSESELPASLSNWGTVTNGSLLTMLVSYGKLTLLLTFLFI